MIEPPVIVLRDGNRCVFSCTCITDVVVTDDGRRGITIQPCDDECPILQYVIRWCYVNGRAIYGLD